MFKTYFSYVKALLGSKKGQGMVEYGLIIALIAVVVIGALVLLGPKIADLFTSIGDSLSATPAP